LTDTPGLEISPPVWSPDGSQLAACRLDGKTTYVFQADTPWSEEPPTQLPPFGDSQNSFWPASWSPDAKLLAGIHWRGSLDTNRITLYSFDGGSYRIVTGQLGDGLTPDWLEDSRRLMFNGQSDDRSLIFFLDTASGDTREVLSSESLSAAPNVQAGEVESVAISPDNRSLYVHWSSSDSDIWMLTLEEQE